MTHLITKAEPEFSDPPMISSSQNLHTHHSRSLAFTFCSPTTTITDKGDNQKPTRFTASADLQLTDKGEKDKENTTHPNQQGKARFFFTEKWEKDKDNTSQPNPQGKARFFYRERGEGQGQHSSTKPTRKITIFFSEKGEEKGEKDNDNSST